MPLIRRARGVCRPFDRQHRAVGLPRPNLRMRPSGCGEHIIEQGRAPEHPGLGAHGDGQKPDERAQEEQRPARAEQRKPRLPRPVKPALADTSDAENKGHDQQAGYDEQRPAVEPPQDDLVPVRAVAAGGEQINESGQRAQHGQKIDRDQQTVVPGDPLGQPVPPAQAVPRGEGALDAVFNGRNAILCPRIRVQHDRPHRTHRVRPRLSQRREHRPVRTVPNADVGELRVEHLLNLGHALPRFLVGRVLPRVGGENHVILDGGSVPPVDLLIERHFVGVARPEVPPAEQAELRAEDGQQTAADRARQAGQQEHKGQRLDPERITSFHDRSPFSNL